MKIEVKHQHALGATDWQHVATVPADHADDAMACAFGLALLADLAGERATWRLLADDGTPVDSCTADGGWLGLEKPMSLAQAASEGSALP